MVGNLTYTSFKRLLALTAAFVVTFSATALMAGAASNADVWHNYPTLGASSGDVFSFTPGDGSLAMGSEGDPEKFVSLEVGGYVLSSNVYTVGGDGCTVTVSGTYLNSFDAGEYAVRVVFTDGETNATLKIGEVPEAEAGMLEGGSVASIPPAASSAPPAASSTPAAPTASVASSVAPQASAQQPHTGLNTVLLGLLTLSGGSAAVFGLGRKWLK